MKIYGLEIIEEMVNEENSRRAAKKTIINKKVEEMVINGMDKEMAKILAKVMFEDKLIDTCGFVEA